MESQKPSKKQKFIPFLIGLILALLVCGIPLLGFVSTGRLRQVTEPFAYAAQTVAVAPAVGATGTATGISSYPTEDISALPYSQRYKLADTYISEALSHSFNHEYAEEILSWDKVLELIPENAEFHYNRGTAYLNLLNNQRSQEEYIHYLELAGEDFNNAIALEPYYKGDYYLGRFKYYDNLSAQQINRIDRMHLEQVAYDNLLMANQLGNYDPLAERYVVFSNIVLGNCDAAIEKANQLIEEATEPVGAYYTGLALGYACRNEPKQALTYIDQAIQLKDTCLNHLERAKILYEMGSNEEALQELDISIERDPYYCGERYYLRGVLHAEAGDLQQAQEDLSFGMGQTWGQGGLLSYGLGKISLAQGDQEAALRYFQEAEATYQLADPILAKIQADLTALGGEPLEVALSSAPATPIPTQTPALTPRPNSSPDPARPTPVFTEDPMLQGATIINIDDAVAPVNLGWGFSGLWRFQPAQPLDHREVQRLSVWLVSPDTSQRLPRQISLWNFRNNMWGGPNELHWGENKINTPDEYVSPNGDVYVYLVNDDDTLETTIDRLGITLVLQRSNGSVEVHGITP